MRLKQYTQNNYGLGSDIRLSIVSSLSTEKVNTIFKTMWYTIFKFERQFSRFIPESELSVFNRRAGLKNYISNDFVKLLRTSENLSRRTNNLYNPFVLPALHRAGYIQSAAPGYENDVQENYSKRSVTLPERLKIGEDWAQIPHGTALDLGGCGKGYLADLLATYLDSQKTDGYWLSLGGDIITKGLDENNTAIQVAIQSAKNPQIRHHNQITCPVSTLAIATSGTFVRENQKNTGLRHHIIDPQTTRPANTDVVLATVCASSAVLADVLASCAVILGSKEAVPFLIKQGASSVLLQCYDKKQGMFDIVYGDNISKPKRATVYA